MESDVRIEGGTLGPYIQISIASIMFILILPFINWKKFKFLKNKWVYVVIIMSVVSLINPYNVATFSTLVFLYFFIIHILLFEAFYNIMDRSQIIKGIFDGLILLCIIQFILAICFPVFQISTVTKIFHESAEIGATRYGQRDGAVGMFSHPGSLALFILIASSFFMSCSLNLFNRKKSNFILVINSITLILTYSRTAYLVYVSTLFIIYYIYKNPQNNLFSFRNIFKVILPITGILIWVIYFSPLNNYFLNSNIEDMAETRMIYYYISYQAFLKSPALGVGFNAHRDFLTHNISLINSATLDPFISENPIHNIHLILLVEVGLIGFILWIFFLIYNITKSKYDLATNKNKLLSLSVIGIILAISFYGLTGWAPFSITILPFLLIFIYFSIRFRDLLAN
ncbi:MAG: O-antigen ligase family protein [Larkinella arboricola]